MKFCRFSALVLAIGLGSGSLWAQTKGILTLTPKVGVNFADFIVNHPEIDVSLAKLGWNVGIDGTFGNRLVATSGLHFYRTGSAIKLKAEDSAAPVTTSQIKMPLGLAYRLLKVDYFRLWLKSDLAINYTLRMLEGRLKNPVTDYNNIGLSSRFGLGMDLGRLAIEVNYERTLTDITNDRHYTQNKLISVLVGIRI